MSGRQDALYHNRRDYRDDMIEDLVDADVALREMVRSLEADVITYRDLLSRCLTRIHELEGDDLPGHWEKLDADVTARLHKGPVSVVARLKRRKRILEAENQRLRLQLSTPRGIRPAPGCKPDAARELQTTCDPLTLSSLVVASHVISPNSLGGATA